MESIEGVICVVAMSVILCVASLVFIGMRPYSAFTLGLIVGLAIMFAIFSPTKALAEPMSLCTLTYVCYILFVVLWVVVYALIKCLGDFQ